MTTTSVLTGVRSRLLQNDSSILRTYTVAPPPVHFEDLDLLDDSMHLKILYGKLETLQFMTIES